MIDKKLYMFVVVASSYMVGMFMSPYLLGPIHKAVPILMLAWWMYQSGSAMRSLAVTALIASAIGDIILDMTFDDSFAFGLLSFAVAQLLYACIFYMWREWSPAKKWPLVLISIFFLCVLYVLLPRSGAMWPLISLYATAIMLMLCGSILVGLPKRLIVGASIFVVSDTLIGLNRFVYPIPYADQMIMLTYYTAQWLIFSGIIVKSLSDSENRG